MKDKRGVNRGACTGCTGCDEYDFGSGMNGHLCEYCGCLPMKHTVIDDDQSSSGAQVHVQDDQRVAFYAYQSHNMDNPANSSIIVFDSVLVNTRNVYDSKTGKFTAPFDGTYELGLTITAQHNGTASAEIVVNDKQMCTSYAGSPAGYRNTAHNMVLVNLKKGDVVFARVREFSNSFLFYGNKHMYCNMSGKMLFRS